MKIIVVGGTGTIGKAVADVLAAEHEVIRVGNRSGDFTIDFGDKRSIEDLFKGIRSFDALVSAAGKAKFAKLGDLSDEDFLFSLSHKLMGQVNLVRIGHHYINAGGSFTLTSGILGQHPIEGSAAVSIVNTGLEGFIRSASLELSGRARVNLVSPGWVRESMEAKGMDSTNGMPAAQLALTYKASVEGQSSGEVFSVGGSA